MLVIACNKSVRESKSFEFIYLYESERKCAYACSVGVCVGERERENTSQERLSVVRTCYSSRSSSNFVLVNVRWIDVSFPCIFNKRNISK